MHQLMQRLGLLPFLKKSLIQFVYLPSCILASWSIREHTLIPLLLIPSAL
jgi:hypothetical protein